MAHKSQVKRSNRPYGGQDVPPRGATRGGAEVATRKGMSMSVLWQLEQKLNKRTTAVKMKRMPQLRCHSSATIRLKPTSTQDAPGQ
ncbi:hypothetical protein ACLKA6_018297 [Drosophila palustris]